MLLLVPRHAPNIDGLFTGQDMATKLPRRKYRVGERFLEAGPVAAPKHPPAGYRGGARVLQQLCTCPVCSIAPLKGT